MCLIVTLKSLPDTWKVEKCKLPDCHGHNDRCWTLPDGLTGDTGNIVTLIWEWPAKWINFWWWVLVDFTSPLTLQARVLVDYAFFSNCLTLYWKLNTVYNLIYEKMVSWKLGSFICTYISICIGNWHTWTLFWF